jgi:hypothetical protein
MQKEMPVPAGTIEMFNSSSLTYSFASASGQSIVPSVRDGSLSLHVNPALRTGLLSLSPFLLRPCRVRVEKRLSGYGGQVGTSSHRGNLNRLSWRLWAAAGPLPPTPDAERETLYVPAPLQPATLFNLLITNHLSLLTARCTKILSAECLEITVA